MNYHLKEYFLLGQNNYTEILGKMYIVNALMMFTGIWTLFSIENTIQEIVEIQQELSQTQIGEDQKQQLDQLKNTLADIQFSAPIDKPPHNPNKYEITIQNDQSYCQ